MKSSAMLTDGGVGSIKLLISFSVTKILPIKGLSIATTAVSALKVTLSNEHTYC